MIKMQLKKQHFLLRQTYDTQRTLQITMFATAEYRHVPRWRKKKNLIRFALYNNKIV